MTDGSSVEHAVADLSGAGVVDATVGDDDVATSWARSGAQWLTDPAVGVPLALARRVVGLSGALDDRGAGIATLVGEGGLGLLAERAASMGLPPADRTSAGGASRLVRAADGWFVMSLARDDDVSLIPAWLGCELGPGGADWGEIGDVVAERPVAELSSRAALLGLPFGAVGEVIDARPVLGEWLGEGAPRHVAGALVVNLAALWAGPLCADLLSRLGARTVTVESTRRPDGARLARRFFEGLHGRSESVALDLATQMGRADLRRLLLAADVVIEGSRPRALEQMGIDVRDIVRRGPKVWVSITARGRGETDRDRVGFGDDSAAIGGLVGWVGAEPRFIADAVADPVAGLTAAHMVAELLDRDGRWLVDVALARVSRSVADGTSVAASVAASAPRPRSDPGGPLPLGRDTERILATC